MISVIVPNYNHAPYLRQRIDSILDQTYQDFELILLDDCSTDNSREILLSYQGNPHVSQIVCNRKNSGSPFIQWKKGIDFAKGDYIWIAESDDYCEPAFLENLYNKIIEDQSVIGFCQSNLVDEHGNIYDVWDCPSHLYDNDWCQNGVDLINEYANHVNIIPNASAVIFKKDCFETIDFNLLVKFKACGDWFTWIQILSQGKCSFMNLPLNNFRRLVNSTTNINAESFNNIKEIIWIYRFLKKNKIPYDINWLKNEWIYQAHRDKKIFLTHNFFSISWNYIHLSFFEYLKIYKFLFKRYIK